MKSNSLKTILYDTIKKHPVYLEEMYEICEANGYLISNGNRRIRELCHSGLIERIWGKNAIIGYKISGQKNIEILLEEMPEWRIWHTQNSEQTKLI